MQAYERKLKKQFIRKLNELYEDEHSWWHKKTLFACLLSFFFFL